MYMKKRGGNPNSVVSESKINEVNETVPVKTENKKEPLVGSEGSSTEQKPVSKGLFGTIKGWLGGSRRRKRRKSRKKSRRRP